MSRKKPTAAPTPTLFDGVTVVGDRVVKRRRRQRLCESKYVKFQDGLYQARIPIGPFWQSINLGLYPSEPLAAAASDAVCRLLARDGHLDPLTVWKATRKAQAAGAVRRDVLPKYVLQKGGQYYVRTGRSYGNLMGPFPSPVEACCRAMDQRIEAARAARSAAVAASS